MATPSYTIRWDTIGTRHGCGPMCAMIALGMGVRFVLPKTEEQQSRAALFRARERLVHQRTELVNALRALLYEFGHVLPAGIRQLSRIDALLDTEDGALPLLVRDECRDLLEQIAEKTVRIDARTQKAQWLAERTYATAIPH